MPQVSIIMPAFNAGGTFAKSIGSVLSQSFTDWELLIIDDGSTDNTAFIANGMAQRDSRIRVFHRENAGVSAARNLGLEEARGELIAFLDADDAYDLDYLQVLTQAMERHGATCAACGYTLVFDDAPPSAVPFPMTAGVYSGEAIRDGIVVPLLSDRLRANRFFGYIWRFLFRRDVIRDNNIRFSGAYLEDELFLIEYFSHPAVLAVSDRCLYRYYQNPEALTQGYQGNCVGNVLHALERKKELVERFGINLPAWWVHNAAWAGLLTSIENIFAPGSEGLRREKTGQLRRLRDFPEFSDAVEHYTPTDLPRRKALEAWLFTARLYSVITLLYTLDGGR